MNPDQGWFISVLALVGMGLLLLLSLVWLSIERTNLSYGIEQKQGDIETTTKLIAKLEVERDNLLSPYQLNRLAHCLGLGPATPGQIRRIKQATEPKAAQ